MNNKNKLGAIKFAETFVNTNHLSKQAFIKLAFDTVFDMLPEAEKGSYFELSGECYIPVYSKGYDINILKQLILDKDKAFIDYENADDHVINVYESVIEDRKDDSMSPEMIKTLKTLGTYGNFISLFAPIKFESHKIGVMCFDNFTQQHFSEDSKITLKIYAQLLSNFYAMRLYQEKSEQRYENIISALVSAIEIKDAYTKGHANRVMDICDKIAVELNFTNERRHKLKHAAILHDVGKIGVATEILNKPGKLTEYEFDEIKKHPEKAKKILESIEEFEDITEYAYCHHEHYNGKGYPRGLKMDEIPFEAAIIQIADAFDAMTSKRAYRDAFTKEKALKILDEESGIQFHPDLVKLMNKLFQSNIL